MLLRSIPLAALWAGLVVAALDDISTTETLRETLSRMASQEGQRPPPSGRIPALLTNQRRGGAFLPGGRASWSVSRDEARSAKPNRPSLDRSYSARTRRPKWPSPESTSDSSSTQSEGLHRLPGTSAELPWNKDAPVRAPLSRSESDAGVTDLEPPRLSSASRMSRESLASMSMRRRRSRLASTALSFREEPESILSVSERHSSVSSESEHPLEESPVRDDEVPAVKKRARVRQWFRHKASKCLDAVVCGRKQAVADPPKPGADAPKPKGTSTRTSLRRLFLPTGSRAGAPQSPPALA